LVRVVVERCVLDGAVGRGGGSGGGGGGEPGRPRVRVFDLLA